MVTDGATARVRPSFSGLALTSIFDLGLIGDIPGDNDAISIPSSSSHIVDRESFWNLKRIGYSPLDYG